MYYSKDREKTAELRKLKEQRDAEEKRQKWIRELEARDDEEKAIKTRLHEKIQAAEANFGKEGEAQNDKANGGILGKIGFWSSSEKKPSDETASDLPADEPTDKKHKRENPKSSLGALGEIISTQKKDGDGKKPN